MKEIDFVNAVRLAARRAQIRLSGKPTDAEAGIIPLQGIGRNIVVTIDTDDDTVYNIEEKCTASTNESYNHWENNLQCVWTMVSQGDKASDVIERLWNNVEFETY